MRNEVVEKRIVLVMLAPPTEPPGYYVDLQVYRVMVGCSNRYIVSAVDPRIRMTGRVHGMCQFGGRN